jgi:hypothetical protein
MTCEHCQSAVCDGKIATCMGCGQPQCSGNGLGRGCCTLCHFGILPGWSGSTGVCSYKGCGKPGAFAYVCGKRYVCTDHASQAKIRGETLRAYADRQRANPPSWARGLRQGVAP